MDDIEDIRRLLREEQQKRKEAERRASAEQQKREEEQQRREEAERRASAEQQKREEERQKREEEQQKREEEQQRREEAERRASAEQQKREEEQQRREEAERRTSEEQRQRKQAEELSIESQLQTLPQYIEACHSIDIAIEVVTERSLTTQGAATDPTGRPYPKRIIPWEEFPTLQEETWDQLSISPSFSSQRLFPSLHQLQYVKSSLHPVSSEDGLRYVERDAVENAVERLVKEAFNDPLVRNAVGLEGTITFESHTNLGNPTNSISESIENTSLSERDTFSTALASAPKTPARKKRRKARGKGNRADQFCIYKTSGGRSVAALAIEYKAPHKLTVDEVVKGLEAEIQPERDVINQKGEGFAFNARWLSAAVVTQLFSYMIGKGIQYGYVCTGQTFIFLYIPDDPSTVYFSVCVPKLDVQDDDETRLHRTAVAQVFAFILRALRARTPPESWHDEAERLDTWAVEVDDILRTISPKDRKPKSPKNPPYKAQRWKGFKRSPIRTRSRCKLPDDTHPASTDEDEGPPSPTARLARLFRQVKEAAPSTGRSSSRGAGAEQSRHQGTTSTIQSRPFCTQECLLGLAHGGSLDENCPNANYHGKRHISRLRFLQLLRAQLATDRGHDADCTPLHLTGSRGSLFKLRLSSHGYTLVAKGVEGMDRALLQHENGIYNQLQAIQGKYVPVCLGSIDLVLPYYYDCGIYTHFMLLSWAGKPLFDCFEQTTKASLLKGAVEALEQLHKFRVLHHDAEMRNMLYDTDTGNIMIVDFERAEFRGLQNLGCISSNDQDRKRKRKIPQKRGDDFARELRFARHWMERAIGPAYR